MANTYSLDLESSSSQYAKITDASQTGLDITGDLTLETWLKLETLSVGYSGIITKFSAGNGSFTLVNVPSGLQLKLSDDGNSADEISQAYSFSTDTWYHIAVTFDASESEYKFYVNGSQVGTTQTGSNTSIYNSSADLEIGKFVTNYTDGKIDEVRIWNVVRTASEISDNYNKELTGSETGLQGYWKFNNDYTDETSNGNDLTAVNSPTFSTDVPVFETNIKLDSISIETTVNDVSIKSSPNVELGIINVETTLYDVYVDSGNVILDTISVVATPYNLSLANGDNIVLDTINIVATIYKPTIMSDVWTNQSKVETIWTNKDKI